MLNIMVKYDDSITQNIQKEGKISTDPEGNSATDEGLGKEKLQKG